MQRNNVEVCFTPAVFDSFFDERSIVVVVDILRATSSICTAFMNGVKKIIPVATLEEAKEYKAKGFLVAAERDGIVRDFADFGNSPFNFTAERVKDKEVVYSTTNGTNTIMMAGKSFRAVIGSYLNHAALVDYITGQNRDILILCAGWKQKFNLEDTLFAGALADALISKNNFNSVCDSTLAAIDLWDIAKDDLMNYIRKVAQHQRLKNNNLDDSIEYCHTFDLTNKVPYLTENYLTVSP
jgi:2-phosphosulfolactate phosphatase